MNATHSEAAQAGPSTPADPRSFDSFASFYPFYLNEHRNPTCRRLHFVGSSLTLLCLIALVVTRNPWWLLAGLLCGYGFAWVGHFGFEKEQAGFFQAPALQLYGRLGDVPGHVVTGIQAARQERLASIPTHKASAGPGAGKCWP